MVSTMERLPLELVYSILQQSIRLARSNKNELMQLRLVCKKWDEVLREYVCKTTQVEFSRLVRGEPTPDASVVPAFGHLVQALHFDMMVIRDQGSFAYGACISLTTLTNSLRGTRSPDYRVQPNIRKTPRNESSHRPSQFFLLEGWRLERGAFPAAYGSRFTKHAEPH